MPLNAKEIPVEYNIYAVFNRKGRGAVTAPQAVFIGKDEFFTGGITGGAVHCAHEFAKP